LSGMTSRTSLTAPFTCLVSISVQHTTVPIWCWPKCRTYGFSQGINAFSMPSGKPLTGSNGWGTMHSMPFQFQIQPCPSPPSEQACREHDCRLCLVHAGGHCLSVSRDAFCLCGRDASLPDMHLRPRAPRFATPARQTPRPQEQYTREDFTYDPAHECDVCPKGKD